MIVLKIPGTPSRQFRDARSAGRWLGRVVSSLHKQTPNARRSGIVLWGFDWLTLPDIPDGGSILINTRDILTDEINMLGKQDKASFADAYRRALRNDPHEWVPRAHRHVLLPHAHSCQDREVWVSCSGENH